MKRQEYSSGMTKLAFWFLEFKKMINLLNSGMTFDEIKDLNIKENIFSVPTVDRATRIFNTVSRRVKVFNKEFYIDFGELDIANQKLVTLIAVMASDTLFFDFVYEVYREKLLIGINEIADSDFSVFFKDKQLQNDRVAKWTDHTLKRLGASYKTVLMESGVLERATGTRKIKKPIFDVGLEEKLKNYGMEIMIHTLTGAK